MALLHEQIVIQQREHEHEHEHERKMLKNIPTLAAGAGAAAGAPPFLLMLFKRSMSIFLASKSDLRRISSSQSLYKEFDEWNV